ncbi:MAG: NUDIX hydrolase [Acidobacteria bacterium]|nr:NUDIX hydrolase [Acidobacteriota bacterium]
MPEVDREQLPPRSGESFDEEVPARPASSVIVLRDDPFEVLMMRRTPQSTFVPNAWIFPGGAVEPSDRDIAARLGGDETMAHRVCALRELIEEVSIGPDGAIPVERRDAFLATRFPDLTRELLDRLVPTSRWITPVGVPKRFDTWFYLFEVPPGTDAVHDEIEGVDHRWITPSDALEKASSREMPMLFPTLRNLEAIAGFSSPRELLQSRKDFVIRPVRPVLVVENGRTRIELPGEP